MKAEVKGRNKVKGRTLAYGRVSTDRQDERSQKTIIAEYAAAEGVKVDDWIFETISSRTARGERELAGVLAGLKAGDTLIVSEPSRLARGGMIELAGVVDIVKQAGARLIVVNGAGGRPMVFASGAQADTMSEMALAVVGWAANMERQNISERTRNALKARKAAGVKLGRPRGQGKKVAQAAEARGIDMAMIEKMRDAGASSASIAKMLGLDSRTVLRWAKVAKDGTDATEGRARA